MINDDLYGKLRKYFIVSEHHRDFVPMSASEFNESEMKALERYRNEPVFHAKVNYITSQVFHIIKSCDAPQELHYPYLKTYR